MSEDEVVRPEFEVWNHLSSGWDLAHQDIADKLHPDDLEFYTRAADVIVGALSEGMVGPHLEAVREKLTAMVPGLAPDTQRTLFTGLLQWYAKDEDPFLRHAVELRIGREGLDRAIEALDRYRSIVPQLVRSSLPMKAHQYLREALQAYLFGFDAAAMSLCRSALEHAARTALMQLGVYSDARLRREKPTLEELIERLKQSGALYESYRSASNVRERGNTVVHDHMYEPRIRQQMALRSIVELSSVLEEIVP